MNTDTTWQTDCEDLEATMALASRMGRRLRGGEVLELRSDLGGGKTTFTKGLVQGLGSPDLVSSPSFTLSNTYAAGKLTVYHFDFYRLSEPGIMRNELTEVIADPNAVAVIEWADIVEDVLPADHMTINITASSEHGRHFTVTIPDTRRYVLEGEA